MKDFIENGNSFFSVLDKDRKELLKFEERICYATINGTGLPKGAKYIIAASPVGASPYNEQEVRKYAKKLKAFKFPAKYLGKKELEYIPYSGFGDDDLESFKDFYVFEFDVEKFKNADERTICLTIYRYLHHKGLNKIPDAFIKGTCHPSAYTKLIKAHSALGRFANTNHAIVSSSSLKNTKTKKEYETMLNKYTGEEFTGMSKYFIKY